MIDNVITISSRIAIKGFPEMTQLCCKPSKKTKQEMTPTRIPA